MQSLLMIWKRGKKNASTVSHGLPGLCQIYLTGSWRGNWLLAGTCSTYLHMQSDFQTLHISMPPDFQTG